MNRTDTIVSYIAWQPAKKCHKNGRGFFFLPNLIHWNCSMRKKMTKKSGNTRKLLKLCKTCQLRYHFAHFFRHYFMHKIGVCSTIQFRSMATGSGAFCMYPYKVAGIWISILYVQILEIRPITDHLEWFDRAKYDMIKSSSVGSFRSSLFHNCLKYSS